MGIKKTLTETLQQHQVKVLAFFDKQIKRTSGWGHDHLHDLSWRWKARIEKTCVWILQANNTVILGSKHDSPASVADGIKQRDYYENVSNVADDVKRAIKDKEITDAESLDTYLHETCDGAGRVIYTAQAQDCLRYSSNDSAYVNEFGGEEPNWSSMAFAAFRQDIIEELERRGIDVNDPCPEEEEEEEEEGEEEDVG